MIKFSLKQFFVVEVEHNGIQLEIEPMMLVTTNRLGR